MESFDDIPKTKSKPKGKANGFLKYMLRLKAAEERKGNFMSMEEAQLEAGKIWPTMSKEDREQYEFTGKESTCSSVKYNSIGVSFDEMERRKKEALKKQRKMELTIQEILQTAAEKNQLNSQEFYFISTSYYCISLSGEAFPAEIALAKFNLRDGVIDSWSSLLNPGPLPLGMAATAKDHCEKTHRIPVPPQDKVHTENDFGHIYSCIMKFLIGPDGDRKVPPIFVESGPKGDRTDVTQLVLDKILKESGADQNFSFRVYPIEQLLFRLQKMYIAARNERFGTSYTSFPSVFMAHAMLLRDEFQYSDLGCDFHREEDNNANCCLSEVIRWGYQFCRICLDPDHEKLQPGQHCPMKTYGISEIDSLSSRDSWDSTISNSFRNMKVDDSTTQKTAKTDSEVDTHDDDLSIESLELTHDIPPSTTDETEVSVAPKSTAKYPSYSQLFRGGRGGKSSQASSSSSKRA